MNKTFLLSFLVACGLFIPDYNGFCQTAAKVSDGTTGIRLQNGLKVILIEEHAFPTVSCQVWFHAGSTSDPAGASGMCHVVEHLLTENSKGPSGSLARQLISNGGKFDAFTSDDFTVFIENLPPSQLELALSLQAQRLNAKQFGKKEVDVAIQQVLQETEGGAKNYERLLARELRSLSYSRHPYRNWPSGLAEETKDLTPNVVNDFCKENFSPQNATLIVAGDINPADALPLIQKTLGPIAGGAKPAPHLIPREPEQAGERRIYLKYPGKKNKVMVAFHAPSAVESDAAAATVLEHLLGSTSAGLLKQLTDNKVCDSASAAYELKKEPGQLVVS